MQRQVKESWLHQAYWVLYTIATVYSFIISICYWAVIHDPGTNAIIRVDFRTNWTLTLSSQTTNQYHFNRWLHPISFRFHSMGFYLSIWTHSYFIGCDINSSTVHPSPPSDMQLLYGGQYYKIPHWLRAIAFDQSNNAHQNSQKFQLYPLLIEIFKFSSKYRNKSVHLFPSD